MSHRGDLANERKKQIIRSTLQCISDLGYNNLSMQDVAKTAGLSKGIIHYYFKNKQDLMKSVLGTVSTEIESRLAQIDETLPPLQQVKQMVKVYLGVVQENREKYCVNIDFWAQIKQQPEFKTIISNHYQTFREKTAEVLQRGFQTGVFRPLNATSAASIVIGLIDGVSLQWLFDEETVNLEEISKLCEEAVIQFLIAK